MQVGGVEGEGAWWMDVPYAYAHVAHIPHTYILHHSTAPFSVPHCTSSLYCIATLHTHVHTRLLSFGQQPTAAAEPAGQLSE